MGKTLMKSTLTLWAMTILIEASKHDLESFEMGFAVLMAFIFLMAANKA